MGLDQCLDFGGEAGNVAGCPKGRKVVRGMGDEAALIFDIRSASAFHRYVLSGLLFERS